MARLSLGDDGWLVGTLELRYPEWTGLRLHSLAVLQLLRSCRMFIESSFNEFFANVFNGDSVPSLHCISDMVALPVVDARTSATANNIPSTGIKLVPRKGVTDAWFDEMNDLLASRKLTKITHEKQPPTVDDMAAHLPGVPQHLVQAGRMLLSRKSGGMNLLRSII